MQLIGMLDSPYVRRVAISLQMLGLRFQHKPVSVFQTFEAFRAINPVVKAPTLVCDDGEILMESTLILTYAEALAEPGRRLMPTSVPALQRSLQLIGLALAACDKSVQIVYERELRPVEKQHAPWVSRVSAQLQAAYASLESALQQHPLPAPEQGIGQAGVSMAVAWAFTQALVPDVVPAASCPLLARYAAAAEALPAFRAAPHGPGVVDASL